MGVLQRETEGENPSFAEENGVLYAAAPYCGAMKLPTALWLAAAPLLAALSACEVTTSPPEPQTPIDLALDFCSDQLPVWFAFQNETVDWERVTPDADGTFRFTATNRVAIVYVLQNGADYWTEIIGARNTEFEEVSGTSCLEVAGTKQINGTFSGVTNPQRALISMLFSSAFPLAQQTSYSLTQLADRQLDLVASRVNLTTTTQTSDRIIIRRSFNPTNNAMIADLDFAGAEAVSPTTRVAAVTGVGAGELATIYNNFFSQLRTSHTLFYSELSANADIPFPSVPASLTAAGDYHDLFVVAPSTNGESFRGAERYFRTAANQTLALANPLTSAPTFAPLASTPYVRVQMTLQPSGYTSAGHFQLQQQFGQASVTTVNVTVTEGYYIGTSAQPWNVTIPDFSSVSGWQNAWGLQSGTVIDWTVTSFEGRASLIFGAPPIDGETIRFAGRRPASQPIRASRAQPTALRLRSASRAP